MSRKSAREGTYKLIFEFLFNNEANDTTFNLILMDTDFTEDDKEYIKELYKGIIYEYDDLITIIDKYAVKFTTSRMVKSDIAALLIAIYEMKYKKDIPYSVSINEAVDLVKKYSTDKSGAYVNGILSSVYKELNKTSDKETVKNIENTDMNKTGENNESSDN
jgi:N utilization substance protein B